MLILTAGLPFSGKSTFVKYLIDCCNKDILLADPKLLYPKNYISLTQSQREAISIESWEEMTTYLIENLKNEKYLIYDTCASQYDVIYNIINKAKKYDHNIIMVFVKTSPQQCIARSNGLINKNIMPKYISRFKNAIPKLAKEIDNFILIKNTSNNMQNIKKYATNLGFKINNEQDRIYKPKSLSSNSIG